MRLQAPSSGHTEARTPTQEARPCLVSLDAPSAVAPALLGVDAMPTVQAPSGFPGGPGPRELCRGSGTGALEQPSGIHLTLGSAHILLGCRGSCFHAISFAAQRTWRWVPSHFPDGTRLSAG